MANREPVLTRATVAAAIIAVSGVVGWKVDQDLVDFLAGAIAVVAPVVAGWLARQRVTPVPAGRHIRPDEALVREVLRRLDGSAAAVSAATGLSPAELTDLGGVPEDDPLPRRTYAPLSDLLTEHGWEPEVSVNPEGDLETGSTDCPCSRSSVGSCPEEGCPAGHCSCGPNGCRDEGPMDAPTPCYICGDPHDHHGAPHGVVTGDGLTRDEFDAQVAQRVQQKLRDLLGSPSPEDLPPHPDYPAGN